MAIAVASFGIDIGLYGRGLLLTLVGIPIWLVLFRLKDALEERKGKAVSWDRSMIQLQHEGKIIWSLPWHDFGGYKQLERNGDIELLDGKGNSAGIIPGPKAAPGLVELQRALSIYTPDTEVLQIQPKEARIATRGFQAFLVIHGFTFFGLSVWAAVMLAEKGQLADRFSLLIIPLMLSALSAVMFVWMRRAGPRIKARQRPMLMDEWDDARFVESTYHYPAKDLFRKAVLKACFGGLGLILFFALIGLFLAIPSPRESLPIKYFALVLLSTLGLAVVGSTIAEVRLLQKMGKFSGLKLKRHSADSFYILSDEQDLPARLVTPVHRSPNAFSVGPGAYTVKLESGDQEFIFDPAQLERVEEQS